MGKRVLLFVATLSMMSAGLCVIGLCLPMHKMSFFLAKFVRAFRLGTYILSADLEENSNDFCKLINAIKPGFCTGLHGSHELQDLSSRFCVDVVQMAMPTACRGLGNAYMLGVALCIAGCINMVLIFFALWLLWYYINYSCKRKYWTAAVIMMASSTLLCTAILACYYVFVIMNLNSLTLAIPIPGAFILAPQAHGGVYYGYLSLAVAMAVQAMTVVLLPMCRSEDEIDEEDYRERKEMKKWLKAHEHIEDPYGQQPLQAQPLQAQPLQAQPFGGYGAMVLEQQQPLLVGPPGAGPPLAEKPVLESSPSFR